MIKPERRGLVSAANGASAASSRRAEGRPVEASLPAPSIDAPEPEPIAPPAGDLAAIELRIQSPNPGWFATILGEQPVFMVAGRPSWSGRVAAARRVSTEWFAEGHGRATFADAPEDIYVFTDLRPGVPFSLAAADRWKLPVERVEVAPLTPGEFRVVDLEVDAYLRDVHGRVLSPEGEPIQGATVYISSRGDLGRRACMTNGEGEFDFGGVGRDELILQVSAHGYANLVDTRFPADGSPVQLFLERGREVRVQVRSANGESVTDASLTARPPGAGLAYSAHGATDDTGECLLERVAPVDETLELTVSGLTFFEPLEADEVELEVELPDRQPCRVHLLGELPSDSETKLRLRLTPLHPAGTEDLFLKIPGGERQAEFAALFPGPYRAVLELRRNRKLLSTSPAQEFEVVPDQPAAITLEY